MVRSPAKSKESKWSYLRTRPRLYNKPTHRSFKVIWEDSSPDVLGKPQSSPCDAVPPSYSTSSGSKEAAQHTPKVMRSGYESELDEDPIPPSVRKLLLVPSSGKALSAEPLPNLPPSKPSELLKDLCFDSEHSLISECSREALLVKRPLLNITSEPQAQGSKHLPMKEMSRSFGKEQSRKLDFEAGTNGAAVPTSQRQYRTVSMNGSVNAHGTEKRSASKESKNRHSRIHHVEVPKSSPPGNEQVALAEKRMPDVTYMQHSCTTPVAQNIQSKEGTQYTSESESTKRSSFRNRQGVPAKKCMSDASPFVPRAHSTPLPSMKHIISIGSSSNPMELRSWLARWRTAPQLETSPVSSATKNAPMSCISQSTAAESKQHSTASLHSSTKMTQVKTCQDINTAGTDKNGESSPGKAYEVALVEQHDVSFPAHRKADGAKQSSLSKHNQSQAPAEDKQASKRSPKQLHVSFDDQRKYLEHTFINSEVQSEEGSPVIPKLQERGLTRKGKRDAQWGTESPVIPKLQEGAQAKKPKMDTRDLQLSPAVPTVQRRAHRKKHKRRKAWVQVQLYDQPSGLRTKADVTMYDIYLSLALEIIEENRQQCQSEKEKRVMARFYEEVAKDATKIIDELQVYTNELSELKQEMSKMTDLTKKLDRISHGLGKYVQENNIKNVDPYQFYFEDEEDDDV